MTDEVDINELVEDFLGLNSVIGDVSTYVQNLHEERKVTDQQLYAYSNEQKNLKKENEELQTSIEKYKSMLADYNKIKEEKAGIDKTISDLNLQLEQNKKRLEEQKDDFTKQLTTAEEKYKEDLANLKARHSDEAAEERKGYEEKLKNVSEELNKSKDILDQQEKQHALELSKIQLECDTKLQKIQQRHVTQANSASSSLMAQNDIFRKKLKHLQTESEREIKTLNATCTEQKQKIAEVQHQLKLQIKQMNEQRKHHDEQVRQLEKQNRQAQSELRKSQIALKHEQDQLADLQKTLASRNVSEKPPKKRKSMFNPQHNRLNEL